jgi:hypothetical protein
MEKRKGGRKKKCCCRRWNRIRQRRQGRKEIEEKDEQISPRTYA